MVGDRILIAVVAAAAACGHPRPPATAPAAPAPVNALLVPWIGPYGGVPPFDRVAPRDFSPAFEVAMARARVELAAIAGSNEPPTFENTVAALEDLGRDFNRVYEIYSFWSNTQVDDAFSAVEREMAPRLAAFWTELSTDRRVFRRLQVVRATADRLTAVQRRLLEMHHRDFVRAGAELDAAGARRMAAIEERLSTLFTAFSQRVRAAEASCVVLHGEAELRGLPATLRASTAAAATGCGHPGAWAVTNTRSAVAAFLTYAERRDLRERVWRDYNGRGAPGTEHDTNAVMAEILALRRERARLLGYPTYAHQRLATAMAGTPERALQAMETLWRPAVARVREEVAAMQAIADREGQGIRIAPWDYLYYAEQVRKAAYDLDDAEVRPYLQLETLREGMFWVAGELFGLGFAPARDVPVYHPDVRAFEVTERATGRHVGLWLFDPYARPGKYNGGQSDVIRVQERFRGQVTPIISNAAPFVKPGAGEVALLGWRDAQTMFHEFGHALHYLLSSVDYPSLAGGRVPDGYGELPAMLLERWLATPEVLRRFAVDQHGAAMPAALIAKIKRAATFNQGYLTVDYLSSALVDMKLHLAGEPPADPAAFERATLAELGAPEQVAPRFRMQHFTHVFSSDGYAASYYTYLWSDMHAADAFEAFAEAGPYDAALARRLRTHVLSVGNTVDPLDGYRAFRGHDATIDAVLRARGFAPGRGSVY